MAEVSSTARGAGLPGAAGHGHLPQKAEVVVIGGGIAGLSAAHELTRQGHSPLVIESSAAFGGAVRAHRVGGLDLDAGAESFAVARPAVAQLIADLGISDQVVVPEPAGAWVRFEHGEAPLPRGGWLGIPTDPFAPEVMSIIGQDGAARAAIDTTMPIGAIPSDMTLGELVRQRMGEAVLRRLVEPVVGGVHSVNPDAVEIRSIAPSLPGLLLSHGSLAAAALAMRGNVAPAGSAVAGLRGGMHTLTSALAGNIEESGGRLVADTRARSIERIAQGWVVSCESPLGVSDVVAATIVVAVSAPAAAGLLKAHLPTADWPTVTIGTAVRLATIVVDQPALNSAPRGSGVLVSSYADGVAAKALTHATAKWGWLAEAAGADRHVLRLSYGRGAQSAASLPVGVELRKLALADAAELLGVDMEVRRLVDFAAVTWTDVQPPAVPGRTAAIAEISAGLAQLPGVTVVGAWVSGTGLAAVIEQARKAVRRTP